MYRSENISIENGEAFLTEYRLYIGDIEFHSQIQQLIEYFNTSFTDSSSFLPWSKIPGHPIVYLNSSLMDMHLFKFNPNCSIPIPSIHPITYRLNIH